MATSPHDPHVAADTSCVLCDAESVRLREVDGFWIRRCKSCGHEFAELPSREGHVERVYSDTYFFGGGAGYSDYLSERELLLERGRWYGRLMKRFCEPGTVLDVGAASGFTLQALSEAGWQCQGLEPNAGQAEYARSSLGLAVDTGTLETWTTDRSFDLVTMLQVLPHFLDPRQSLQKCAEFLRPGGYLLIETWNRDSWTARLLGASWHEYSPPSVLHWFSRASVTSLAESVGFAYVAHGRPAKWISAGHAKSLLRSKANESLTNRLLARVASVVPDRVAVPYPAEDLFWVVLQRR